MRAEVLARPSARNASFFSSDVGADVTSLRTMSYWGNELVLMCFR
jgi:hypothetical protein